jgi:hypothetical protein
LQEIDERLLSKEFHLFDIVAKPTNYSSERARWGNYHMTGDAHIRTPNERPGLHIFYYLHEDRDSPLTLKVLDCDGKALASLKTKREAGIHKLNWSPRRPSPGTYRFILTDGTNEIGKKGVLKPRILWPVGNPEFFKEKQN